VRFLAGERRLRNRLEQGDGGQERGEAANHVRVLSCLRAFVWKHRRHVGDDSQDKG
jgi:hypothetical protein